jgi:hypothetical protein
MKSLLIASSLSIVCATAIAQPQKPSYAYFEGANLSLGMAQNSTEETIASASTTSKTSAGIAKINYTFALAYPGKLGVSASFDLKNSKVNDSTYLAATAPTEITIEPGLLLRNNSLLYAKVGSYASRYEAGANPSRKLSGTSYGIGIKHYVYGQNFIQLEWTQRKADDNQAGLGSSIKQTSTAALVGFNF